MIARQNAVLPLTPTADHTGKEGYFVKNSSGSAALVAATTDLPIGVITEGQTTSGKDSVAISAGGYAGTVKAKLSGTVAAFALLQLAADGSVITDAGTGTRILVGQALEGGTSTELIEAVLFKPISL